MITNTPRAKSIAAHLGNLDADDRQAALAALHRVWTAGDEAAKPDAPPMEHDAATALRQDMRSCGISLVRFRRMVTELQHLHEFLGDLGQEDMDNEVFKLKAQSKDLAAQAASVRRHADELDKQASWRHDQSLGTRIRWNVRRREEHKLMEQLLTAGCTLSFEGTSRTPRVETWCRARIVAPCFLSSRGRSSTLHNVGDVVTIPSRTLSEDVTAFLGWVNEDGRVGQGVPPERIMGDAQASMEIERAASERESLRKQRESELKRDEAEALEMVAVDVSVRDDPNAPIAQYRRLSDGEIVSIRGGAPDDSSYQFLGWAPDELFDGKPFGEVLGVDATVAGAVEVRRDDDVTEDEHS